MTAPEPRRSLPVLPIDDIASASRSRLASGCQTRRASGGNRFAQKIDPHERHSGRRVIRSRANRRHPKSTRGFIWLHPQLTEDNHLELLGEAAGKTTGQIEALLAARSPKPDVPDTITKTSSASGRAVPLSADHDEVQFTANQQLVDKIEHARNLLSHVSPGRELWPAATLGFAAKLGRP